MSKVTTFTIKKAYALSAIDKAGKRVYYDTDSHSGGYPYWSPWLDQHRTWDELDKIPTFSSTDYMRQDVVSIEVLEVEIQARVVSTTEIVSEVRAKAMAEIAKLELELNRKVALLEGTK
jgi:hypothetical protein